PTVDDPTREAIARACGCELEYRPELWAQIVARFERFKRKPTENNRKQAYVPAGALALENPVGTAPCFIVENSESVLIALPGVPREMEYMLAHAVLPYLREKFKLTGLIKAKVLRTVGIGESMVDERIGEFEKLANPIVGLAAHAGQTDIRITAKAASEAEAEALIAPIEAKIRERLGEFVYGEGQETVEEVVGRLLAERGMTVAVAESGTGGRLAGRLSALPEAARSFRGGMIAARSNDSEHPALGLAKFARVEVGGEADWGLGLIVSAQPGAERIEIALAGVQHSDTHSLGYGGPPAVVATWASTAALNLLRLALLRQK
ncbi:MAG: molybdopterin-binding protein, partial [Anaerolineales bacterium]